MIVRDVKRELTRLRISTVSQLAAELGEPVGIVDGAVAYWESRGMVRRLKGVHSGCAPTACKSCPITPVCRGNDDPPSEPEYLEWQLELTTGGVTALRPAVLQPQVS